MYPFPLYTVVSTAALMRRKHAKQLHQRHQTDENKVATKYAVVSCHTSYRPFIALAIFTMANASSKKAAAGKNHRISHERSIDSPHYLENRLTLLSLSLSISFSTNHQQLARRLPVFTVPF
jgi:hypothetical protein